MSIKFDKSEATDFLKEQAIRADNGPIDEKWVDHITRLSELCEIGNVRTHIAFFGTSLLAKSLNPDVNLYHVKPTLKPTKNAYTARTLAHSVLVPTAIELGIHLGTTGREPLNNQPYFRMEYLGDGTPVHKSSQPAFEHMMHLTKLLSDASQKEAIGALRAFVMVRKAYQPNYSAFEGNTAVTLEQFPIQIKAFVDENSESGKRAQAVAAGLFDLIETSDRVLSGRINDPSRKHPGDVCVLNINDPTIFDKAMEVRDKLVSESDVRIFASICLKHSVTDVALLMVAQNQPMLDAKSLAKWGAERSVSFKLFYGWEDLISETLFWGSTSMRSAVADAVLNIEKRLAEVEVSDAGYTLWKELFHNS